jgi:hypothetical protein
MVTRIHKAVKFTPAPNSPNEPIEVFSKPCEAVLILVRVATPSSSRGSARSSRERARDRGVSVESTATRRPLANKLNTFECLRSRERHRIVT